MEQGAARMNHRTPGDDSCADNGHLPRSAAATRDGTHGPASSRGCERRAEADRDYAERRRMLPLLHGFGRLLMRETDPQVLIERICETLTQAMGYARAWIALIDASRSGITGAAVSPPETTFGALRDGLERGIFPACMTAALDSAQVCFIASPATPCEDCPMAGVCGPGPVMSHVLACGGEVHGVLTVSLPTHVDHGEEQTLRIVAEDIAFALSRITEGRMRIEAERALRQANDIIVRSPAVAFVWVNEAGWPAEYASENVARIFGWEAEDFISGAVSYVDLIHPDDLERVAEEVARATADTNVTMFSHEPYRILTRDGAVRWVDDMTTARRRSDGSVYAYAGILLDITERKRAEEALQEREHRLHTILETTQDGFWLIDPDGRLTEVNQAYSDMSGYSRRELLEMRVTELDADSTSGGTAAGIECILQSGGGVFEARHRRKDGTAFDVEVSATHLRAGGDKLVCFCRDITERKSAEQEVSANHLRLLSIFDGIDEPIYVADTKTYEVVYVNEAMRRIFGTPDGRRCYDYMQGLEAPCPFCTNDKILGEYAGQSYVWEFQNTVNRHWYRCIDKAIAWPDGRTVRYEMALDITERKVAEEELRKFKAVIDRANYGAAIADIEGNLEYTNDYFAQIHGFTTDELVGRHISVFHSDAQMPAVEASLATLFEHGSFDLLELQHAHRDGTEFPMLMNGLLMRDTEGRPQRVFVTATDLREHKRLEAEVRQAQKLESVGRLAGGVAHDLNNLLVPILGYSEVLLADMPPESELHAPLTAIAQAGIRARDLVRQLLAFSRKQILEFRPVDINEVLRRFEKLLRSTIREDITIDIVSAPSLQPTMGDVGQLEQVIMNLAINAQDAMPNGGTLTIETSLVDLDDQSAVGREKTKPGSYVLLAISDTGHGMDADVVEHVFEPFFTTKAEGEGTGLGLATVYGIVKQHGGNVWVTSEPGRGTRFEVCLPAAQQTPMPEEDTGSPAPVEHGPETILLVEDHEQVRDLAHAILTRYGYTVLVAESGEAALELAEAYDGPLDLLLTDVVMREMSGKDIYETLAERYEGLRVVYMSGYTEDVIAHRGIVDKGVNFIQKPFAVQALAAKVRQVLDAE